MIALIIAIMAIVAEYQPAMPMEFIETVLRCENPIVQPEFVGCESTASDGETYFAGLVIHLDDMEFVTGP